jgi:hypothetical protein
MRDIIVEIMVEVLTILAIATKEVKSGRLSKLMTYRSTILDSHVSRKVFEEVDGKHRHRG